MLHRRKKETPCGTDRKGRLTYNGRLMPDSGCKHGRLFRAIDEELEFGPGCDEEERNLNG